MSEQTLLELTCEEKSKLCFVAKVLSSPERIDIVRLLYQQSLSVQQVASALGMPQSSASSNISLLEEAGIIKTKKVVEGGNLFKMCSIDKYIIHVFLRTPISEISQVTSLAIPIGSYMDCYAEFPCGLISSTGFIGIEDEMKSFYRLEKSQAQLIWMRNGFLLYRVENIMPKHKRCKQLTLSMELCSEAPGFDEDYPSDISLLINGLSCGAYHAQGDYGKRRGVFTPAFWPDGLTQYGKWVVWTLNEQGVFINSTQVNSRPIRAFQIERTPYIEFKLECANATQKSGGMNLFGEYAGDYNQAIVLTVEH